MNQPSVSRRAHPPLKTWEIQVNEENLNTFGIIADGLMDKGVNADSK